MANSITENVKAFYSNELEKNEYFYRETKDDAQTFWVNPGSTLSKRIKATILLFTKQGKSVWVIVPEDGNDIRVEMDCVKRDEKLFTTVAFGVEETEQEFLRKELRKDLLKAGIV